MSTRKISDPKPEEYCQFKDTMKEPKSLPELGNIYRDWRKENDNSISTEEMRKFVRLNLTVEEFFWIFDKEFLRIL